jgi:hypothetical protein
MLRDSYLVAGLVVSLLASSAGRAQSPARPGFLPGTEQTKVPQSDSHEESEASFAVTVDPAFSDKLQTISEALGNSRTPEDIARYTLQQADLLMELAATLPQKDRALIIRQVADCLAGPAPYDATARNRLLDLEKQLAQDAPESELASYVTYREIGVTEEGVVVPAVHRHDRLAAFVAGYPKSRETQRALLELATTCERGGKIDEAKAWYGKLAQSFPETKLGRQAQGAVRCLGLEGKVLGMALPLLFTENERNDVPFDIEDLRGKVVIVYFWAVEQERGHANLDRLKEILDRNHGLGVELLCVNLDTDPRTARETLRNAKTPGIHVFQRGGLDGVVPQRFGITSVPHTMLVGRDGVVVRHCVETGVLDEMVKEAVGARRSVRAATE